MRRKKGIYYEKLYKDQSGKCRVIHGIGPGQKNELNRQFYTDCRAKNWKFTPSKVVIELSSNQPHKIGSHLSNFTELMKQSIAQCLS